MTLTVPYQVVNWRVDLAPVPEHPGVIPLPGTVEFANVRGREGDLLILQFRSGSHLTSDKQQALADLELGRVGAACIRPSSPDTIGRIRLLRGIVAVIDLRGVHYRENVAYREKTGLEYERTQFGSNTQPGELIRDSAGNYFVFESDRNGLLVN
ncbi:hypothetical protein, partial [Curtobacterium sp. MMLR14_002]|uniref:hypothetical protein n=1 Tax=Curtobacterium sp. MMLR14_002 TaxID=1898741 RepID=UPI001C0C707E